MANAAVAAGRCDVRVVRPANVYGPGSKPWVEEVARLLTAGRPALVDGGGQNAGLVFVDNVVDVMVRAAGGAASAGDVFNACDELPVTWARYFGDLARIVHANPPRSVPGWVARPMASIMEASGRVLGLKSRPPLTREALHLVSAHHEVPASRARDRLGHRTLVNYDAGMAEVAEWLGG